jgi:hypothetical protein
VINLRSFSEFEEYGFQSDDFLKYSRRIIFNIISTNSVDNPNGIYEYDIDSEIIKIKKSLFKFASKVDGIFWIQNAISKFDYLFNIFFEQKIEFEENINEITFPQK